MRCISLFWQTEKIKREKKESNSFTIKEKEELKNTLLKCNPQPLFNALKNKTLS